MATAFLAVSVMLPCQVGFGGEDSPVRYEVAVTFDDLPLVARSWMDRDTRDVVVEKLIAAIVKHDMPAIGFVNEGKLYDDDRLVDARVRWLEMWLDAGLGLGNHTWGHIDLHKVGLEEYKHDIVRGETVIRPLLDKRAMTPKYFRHPFLHTGRDVASRRGVEAFLAEHGYRVAPVTIDNSEWIFALAYDKAARREDEEAMARIGEAYVSYMERKFEYYERQSREHFDRDIRQILLLHANALNADYLDDLAAMIRQRGYEFVDLDRALQDPAYESEDTFTGRGGISWLHRWVLTSGKPALEGEPRTPQFVLREAGVSSE